jgi:hypothetical protein
MIVEQFDRRTMAAMELALERACGRWSYGGKHNIRKRGRPKHHSMSPNRKHQIGCID